MSVYLQDGMVLLDSGMVATDEGCCCGCSGGCCDPDTSICSIQTRDDCIAASHIFLGCGTTCDGVDCSCCPFFAFRTTVKFSGNIVGSCLGSPIFIPEQTWTKVATITDFNQFECDGGTGCFFNAGTCAGITPFIFIDSNGNCSGNATMSVLIGGNGQAGQFTGTVISCGSSFTDGLTYDFSSGVLDVSFSNAGITYNFHLEAS